MTGLRNLSAERETLLFCRVATWFKKRKSAKFITQTKGDHHAKMPLTFLIIAATFMGLRHHADALNASCHASAHLEGY